MALDMTYGGSTVLIDEDTENKIDPVLYDELYIPVSFIEDVLNDRRFVYIFCKRTC